MVDASLSLFATLAILGALGGLGGCAPALDDLARGERAFAQNQHERALAMFRALEPDLPRLPIPDRAHYAYFRGMTDYRMGNARDARHWLAVAVALDETAPGSLSAEWRTRLVDALSRLDQAFYASLTPPPRLPSEPAPVDLDSSP